MQLVLSLASKLILTIRLETLLMLLFLSLYLPHRPASLSLASSFGRFASERKSVYNIRKASVLSLVSWYWIRFFSRALLGDTKKFEMSAGRTNET